MEKLESGHSVAAQVAKLREYKENGIITADEFNAQLKDVLLSSNVSNSAVVEQTNSLPKRPLESQNNSLTLITSSSIQVCANNFVVIKFTSCYLLYI